MVNGLFYKFGEHLFFAADLSLPNEMWRLQGESFIENCHQKLITNPSKLKEIETTRGLNESTVKQYKLGYCLQDLYANKSDWGLNDCQEERIKNIWLPEGYVIPFRKFSSLIL